jgi:hypothetical protein
VLLLPFLGEEELYNEYRFDEAWNGPHNRLLESKIPDVYKCPSDTGSRNTTSYCVVTDTNRHWNVGDWVFGASVSAKEPKPILVAEVADSGIAWLEPLDLTEVQALAGVNSGRGTCISSHHEGGANVLIKYGDPYIYLNNDVPEDKRRSLLPRLKDE